MRRRPIPHPSVAGDGSCSGNVSIGDRFCGLPLSCSCKDARRSVGKAGMTEPALPGRKSKRIRRRWFQAQIPSDADSGSGTVRYACSIASLARHVSHHAGSAGKGRQWSTLASSRARGPSGTAVKQNDILNIKMKASRRKTCSRGRHERFARAVSAAISGGIWCSLESRAGRPSWTTMSSSCYAIHA